MGNCESVSADDQGNPIGRSVLPLRTSFGASLFGLCTFMERSIIEMIEGIKCRM
jgi:hypothetical protein